MIREDSGDLKTPAVLENRDCTPDVIDVDLETPVEPRKSSMMANQVRKNVPSQPEQQRDDRVRRSSPRRGQWKGGRCRRFSKRMVTLSLSIVI